LIGIPQAILNELESFSLPSIPKALLEVLRLVENDRVAMIDLAVLIKRDTALTARILTIANSPALRQVTEHKNIEQCLVVIGISLLRTITACLAIQSVFPNTSRHQHYNFKGFWRHSLLVSEIAREIAIKLNHTDIEEAYLSALLHDIGQMLLLGGLGEKYGIILDKCSDEESLLNMETPLLGTNHAAVGAWLIDQWKFSSFMADAVMFHHYSADEVFSANQLIQIIWSAHRLSSCYSIDQTELGQLAPDLLAIMKMLDLNFESISEIHVIATERVVMLAEELGISDNDSRSIPKATGLILKSEYFDPAHSEIELKVRDMAVMQPLLLNLLKICNEAEILLSLREASKILFELGDPSFLLLHSEKPTLSGANILGQPELLQFLEIHLTPDQSLAASSILSKQVFSTFDNNHSMINSLVDVQIARILNSDWLLYVPLCCNEQTIGLIVYGLTTGQYVKAKKQIEWITRFAHIASISITTCRSMQERESKQQLDLINQFEQHGRKIIHEAGNPLGIIKNYLQIISNRLPDNDEIRNELDIISEEIDRVSQIVKKINNQPVASKIIGNLDINNLIEGMMTLYGESLFTSRGIFIQKKLDSTITPISADRDLVKQILLNIWKNGSEAMQAGGCFIISTRDSVNLNGEYFTEIQMSDSGPGFPPDVINNVFEPLDPCRKPGHYGIGLSIVESLVEQLNGIIFFHSHPGVGTSFSILLPRKKRGDS